MGSLINQYSKEELEELVRNSFSYAEVISKLGYSTKNGHNQKTVKKRIEYYQISTEHFCYHPVKTNWTDDEIFCENSKVSQSKLRRAFKAKSWVPYQCAVCNLLPFWNGQPLTLTLDHINGKNKDNRPDNLRWICPNCDRQSDTYGTKNKKKLEKGVVLSLGNYDIVPKEKETIQCVDINEQPNTTNNKTTKEKEKIPVPDRAELKNKLWELKNYTQVANHFNVSTTQIRRWCRIYDLPATINIVKYTSEVGWINESWNDIERTKPSLPTLSKSCYMVDKNSGQVLMEFSSRREAGNYIAPKQKRAAIHIGQVCNGLRKSAYGYLWKDKEEKSIS